MKTRIVLTPLIFFGPFAFIPLVLAGLILDIILFNFTGVTTIIAAGLGLGFYVLSFVLSLMVLKTEVKAQNRAIEILREDKLATEEELKMMKDLYKLYNIQYVNDLIMEFLQILLRVLMFFAKLQSNNSSTSSNN